MKRQINSESVCACK